MLFSSWLEEGERGGAVVVVADEPAAHVGFLLQAGDGDPACGTVVETVAEDAFAGRADDVSAAQVVGHRFVGLLGEEKLDALTRFALHCDLGEPGEVAAHVDAIVPRLRLGDGNGPQLGEQPVRLDFVGGDCDRWREHLGRLPSGIVETGVGPVR